MSILFLIIDVFLIFHTVNVICLLSSSSSRKIIDSQTGNENVLDCQINRTRWTLPSILQWYRSINNYTIPIASQFNDYPVHIEDSFVNKYSLLSNGSLKIENIELNDNDTFECRLILIDRGLLDVKEKYFLTLRVNERPRFINLSNSIQIAVQYSTVNLNCQIYGIPNPTVTWYKVIQKREQTIDEENLQLLLANSQYFTLQNVDDSMAGKYRCVGKNRLGFIQNDFQLLIRGSIYWRHFPENRTVKINDSITLKCEGQSSEPLQYQWLKDEVSLSDTISLQDRIRTYSDGLLSINNIEPSDHGSYVCKISTSNSTSIRSKQALITVKYPPIPSLSRQATNITLIEGSLGVCPCLLDAYPPIQSVSWYRNGRSIRIESKGGAYTINSEYSLLIKSADTRDNGEYFCRAQNSEGFGRDSTPFYVLIKEPIQFISKPDSIYYVNEKSQLILPCVAVGKPQPTIKWFKDSIELEEINENLTLEYIEKTDHGLYRCQASNEYTTTNTSTFIVVENITPQAPVNVQYKQISSNILLSWEPGYDGGRIQHFIIWYRVIKTKKGHWNQIRVLPNNATEFLLFDLTLQQTYELTIVGENDFGLGTFSPIVSVYINNHQDLSIGYFYYSNTTNFVRPLSPTGLHLSYSGTNLYITWNHPNPVESSIKIAYYVIQWRSSIVFNNQQSQQSIVIQYPSRSFTLKDIKQSKYIIQVISYSQEGTYSTPIESDIQIQFNAILAYRGSRHLLVSIFCFLTLLTVATLCICAFFTVRYYYYRRSYPKDLGTDLKLLYWCCPSIQSRLNDCSRMEPDRYNTNLLTSNDSQTSPVYMAQQQITSQTIANSLRSSSPSDSFNDSSVSVAKISTIPRCRTSTLSNTVVETPQLTYRFISTENSNVVVSSPLTFAAVSITNEDNKMTSFFQPISAGDLSPVSYGEIEGRKNSSRLPLEAVPELSELTLPNSRYSFTPSVSSTNNVANQSHSVQPSPVLITFDSSSLKRRS
ncbi:unnamed protein product [Rotaria socialis]|uniref:Uncharacterized protein n=1 Tax=Rotaria socialis TaxID=392032 RepID=A0A817UWZ1_9BILA|nr:unnamed protein product [Rotaria socialis]